jgi:hypothetical protein
MKKLRLMFTSAALAAGLLSAQQNPGITQAKGIFVDGGHTGKTAVKFNVMLVRNGHKQDVSTNYAFRNGDEMILQLESNRDSYVYVLNRTVFGDPAKLGEYATPKGISIEKPTAKMSKYRLLFPNQQSGSNNRISGSGKITIPTNGIPFTMDSEPGIEKMYVVVSEQPVNIARMFDLENGGVERNNGGGGGGNANNGGGNGGGRQHDDTDEEVTSQLRAWSDNAQVALAGEKGIGIGGSESYGIAVDAKKPAVVEISLRHYGR